RRELALQVPGVKEELPVDVGHEVADRGLDDASPGERRRRQIVERDLVPVRARRRERQQRPPELLSVLLAEARLELAVLGLEGDPPYRVEQRRDDVDDAARIEDVHCLV